MISDNCDETRKKLALNKTSKFSKSKQKPLKICNTGVREACADIIKMSQVQITRDPEQLQNSLTGIYDDENKPVFIVFLASTDCAGLIIGRGGINVKQLTTTSGAHINVGPLPLDVDKVERLVTSAGGPTLYNSKTVISKEVAGRSSIDKVIACINGIIGLMTSFPSSSKYTNSTINYGTALGCVDNRRQHQHQQQYQRQGEREDIGAGDWTCPSCNFNNFASRQNTCFKCLRDRPDNSSGATAGASPRTSYDNQQMYNAVAGVSNNNKQMYNNVPKQTVEFLENFLSPQQSPVSGVTGGKAQVEIPEILLGDMNMPPAPTHASLTAASSSTSLHSVPRENVSMLEIGCWVCSCGYTTNEDKRLVCQKCNTYRDNELAATNISKLRMNPGSAEFGPWHGRTLIIDGFITLCNAYG